jgi:dienelactone hydrolase
MTNETGDAPGRLEGRDLLGLEGLAELLPTRPFPRVDDPELVAHRLREVLGVPEMPGALGAPATAPLGALNAAGVRVAEGQRWTRDGVDGTSLSWNVGFGPDTQAWLLRPAGEHGPLPGVVALHCHSDVKYSGKEKIADGPEPPQPSVVRLRALSYGGRAMANELARSGMTVLVHDVFGWGSRRFPVAAMPRRSERYAALDLADRERRGETLDEAERYELHAAPHEDALAKLLGLLGTSFGGVVVREDLIAAGLLAGRQEVLPGGVSLVGMSGGGARAILASALSADIRAIGVMSMLSSFRELVDGFVHEHTWMMIDPAIGQVAEWPDLAAARVPRPLFAGYAADDGLFSRAGMHDADDMIAARYAAAGAGDRYRSYWEDAPHSFGVAMQDEFIRWHREVVMPTTRGAAQAPAQPSL